MQIIDVTSVVLKSYEYPNGGWLLVRVKTDGGIEGVGECCVPDRDGRAVFAAKDIIENSFRRVIVGQDVLDIQRTWERIYEVCSAIYDRRGLAIHSLSAWTWPSMVPPANPSESLSTSCWGAVFGTR